MNRPPRVLLLGDSIRMSYQPHIALILQAKDEAVVAGPAENCQFAAYTRERLPVWIEELGMPDVVHWNNGLHDCGHNPARIPVQYPIEEYVAHLRAILGMVRDTGAQVIWATSTPVHPDRPFRPDGWSWRNDEIDLFNEAALAVMRENDVPVNDLHALVWGDYAAYLSEDMLHLSKEGQKVCASAVVDAVRAAIRKR